MRTNSMARYGVEFVPFLKRLFGFLFFLLCFSVALVRGGADAFAAPGCNGTPAAGDGMFVGLTQQQGGFGNEDGIVPFLESKGLINPTRVDKVDGFFNNQDVNQGCRDGEEDVVSAISENNGNSGEWFSDVNICAIAIHAGGGQTVAVYVYDPAVSSGTFTTEELTNNQGIPRQISNIQFFACDEDDPGDPKGMIRLQKKTVGDEIPEGDVGDNTFTLQLTRTSDNQVFSQNITVNGYGQSNLDDAKFTLPPGEYVFSEILPPVAQDIPNNSEWQLQNLECRVTTDENPQDDTVIANDVTITLAANDVVSCRATNKLKKLDEPVGTGRIIIKKTVVGVTDPVQFDFTWIVDNGEGLTNPSQLFNSDASNFVVFNQGDLRVGQYIIEEDEVAGYDLSGLSCNDGNSTVSEADRRATINLDEDETVVCTYVNVSEDDDPNDDVVKKFIKRRVDNLLTHDPDRSRIQRRLDQQREGSMKDTRPMKMSGSFGDGSLKDTNMKFSTSLSQLRAAALAEQNAKLKAAQDDGFALGLRSENYENSLFLEKNRFDIWVEGHISHYDDNEGGYNSDGDFGILYIGADYAVNEWLLVGALVQFDWTKEDIDSEALFGEIEGDGWMIGPYVGMKLSDRLYFNARAAWGESDNDYILTDDVLGTRTGSFKTDRWLATAELVGKWSYRNLQISPAVKLSYGNESQDEFLNSLGLAVSSTDITLGRLTFGPEFSYTHEMESGTIIQPHLVVQGIWNFDSDDIELSNGEILDYEDLRGRIEGGVLVRMKNGISYRLTGNYDGIGDDDFESYGGQLWINVPLHKK